MLLWLCFIYRSLDFYPTFILYQQTYSNSPSFSYFPHNSVKWLGLRDNVWSKITQLAFMSKGDLELIISWRPAA